MTKWLIMKWKTLKKIQFTDVTAPEVQCGGWWSRQNCFNFWIYVAIWAWNWICKGALQLDWGHIDYTVGSGGRTPPCDVTSKTAYSAKNFIFFSRLTLFKNFRKHFAFIQNKSINNIKMETHQLFCKCKQTEDSEM